MTEKVARLARRPCMRGSNGLRNSAKYRRISGLVVEYIVAIDVTRVRFPADALLLRIKLLLYRDKQ